MLFLSMEIQVHVLLAVAAYFFINSHMLVLPPEYCHTYCKYPYKHSKIMAVDS